MRSRDRVYRGCAFFVTIFREKKERREPFSSSDIKEEKWE